MDALDWSWVFGNGSTSTSPSPSAQYEVPGTFMAELVASNACGSDTLIQELVLGPAGAITIDGPLSLCPDSAATFTVSLGGADIASVAWSNGGATPSTLFSTPVDTDLVVAVTGTDGCAYSDTTTISVLPQPEAQFSTDQDPCDSVVHFIDSSSGALSSQWQFGNGETSVLPDPVMIYVTSGTYAAMLIVTGECGTDTASLPIAIGALGTLSLEGPTLICDNEPVRYEAVLLGSGLDDVVWSTGDTTSAIDLSINNDLLLTANVIGDDECAYQAETLLHVIGAGGEVAAYVPNVFTPNGDSWNEVFVPVMADPDGFREMLIFNRWGEEIHSTTTLSDPWDGRYEGKPVPDGTYVYIVRWKDRCSGVMKEEHGHVTVLR